MWNNSYLGNTGNSNLDGSMRAKRGHESEDRTQPLKDVCRHAGLKATHQRLEVLREMTGAADHPSAEQVYERVRPRIPTISLDTVYRTLATFEQKGILARLNVLDGRIRYDAARERHDHFVCTKCKTVIDCQAPEVARMRMPPGAKAWGTVTGVHVEIRGVCADCLKQRRRPKKGSR
jgi:Fur family peroxide stress response transcriptional regulator